MSNSTTKKRLQAFGILFLIIGTFSTAFNVSLLNFTSNFLSTDEEINKNEDKFHNDLKTADYSSSYSSTGKDINVTLHQSYLNNSFNTLLNTSDSNNNKFTLPCPTDTSFNSSYTRFEINGISAPNKSIIVEEGTTSTQTLRFEDYALSFRVPGNGILDNFSLCFSELDAGDNVDGDIMVQLWSSEYDSGENRPKPLNLISAINNSFIIPNASNTVWFNFTNLNKQLTVSSTYDNTFFIYLRQNSFPTTTDVRFHYEGEVGDGDSLVWRFDGLNWNHEQNIEPSFKLHLIPLNNTPKPSQVNLKVNASTVNDITWEQGYWESSWVNSSTSGSLEYLISADWWDVTCTVSQVQINYTKTDLIANSHYNILGSGQSLDWNCTLGVIDNFDVRFNNFEINFTIPVTWENYTAFNGVIDKTSDINPGIVGNSYRNLQILNAGNGTNWYITAQSKNLIDTIHTFVSAVDLSVMDFTDNINFIANFSEVISDGTINLSVYSPAPDYYLNHTYIDSSITPGSELSLGTWTISDDVIEYGVFKVQVWWHNDTAGGFLEKDITIMGVTDLKLESPLSGQDLFPDYIFNITVFYNDTGLNSGDQGIADQQIDVNTTILGWVDEGNGYYNIEINTNDYSFGWNYIEIEAYDTYYHNASTVFSFHLRLNTTISPLNSKDFGDVIRGTSIQYVFNYSDVLGSPITLADQETVQLDPSFGIPILSEVGGGNYSIQLDTSNVQASITAYECIFNITKLGKETQYITIYLTVILSQTEIQIIGFDTPILKKDGLNQTISIFFNDTDNNQGIPGLPVSNVTVIDNQTVLPRPIWLYPGGSDGYYTLNITVSDLNSGYIRLMINITFEPNYNTSIAFIDFYLRGNLTDTNIISISDPGGEGTLIGIGSNYTCFEGRDLLVEFNITDFDNGDALVTGAANSYSVEYIEIGNPLNQGFLGESLGFSVISYQGTIDTTNLPSVGTYAITISIFKTNFEKSTVMFNLTLRARYLINISVVDKPTDITAGDSINIIIKAEYYNGSDWLPIDGTNVRITPYFSGNPGTSTLWTPTNSTGEVAFEILTSNTITNISLIIEVESSYYHIGDTKGIYDIVVHAVNTGLTFEDLLPYLIIIGVAAAAVASSVGVYKGVVVPKKREKSRILTEVKTIFDDAINLEHILVLYKGTGTCIYFKSYGSEQIDPELISGFISAISSFGKDLVSQEELNEISYGDKMLLLSDGEYIRVALVLGKKASLILRRNLMEFIHNFEKSYGIELPNWRGQLNIFRESGTIVDEILSTSIILPHEITYEFSPAKALKKPQSREVLKIAKNLMKDSERNFFFIATLLKEATEKSRKDTAEIFMGIKELRDRKILMPIEISTIEAKPISQQELNLINQKVSQLVRLSSEEKQKLINDLAQMGPAEREAYFASLSEQQEIVSAPIEAKIGAAVINTVKGAKKEIKNLKKNGLAARKEKDYDKSIKIFQNALKIASSWELVKESQEFDDFMRLTKIEDLKTKMKTLEKEARLAAKEKKYNEATQKYRMSSKIASEIFKLGEDLTKEVKRLSNKAKEYEKLI
ncbi:MAG: hypothetical protein ACFE9C_03925 [Candidatus Hodarchaeota archaeon]